MRELINNEAEIAIKKQLGYTEDRCGECCHYVAPDCSGNQDALDAHCTLCSPIFIRVVSWGHCSHFHRKNQRVKE